MSFLVLTPRGLKLIPLDPGLKAPHPKQVTYEEKKVCFTVSYPFNLNSNLHSASIPDIEMKFAVISLFHYNFIYSTQFLYRCSTQIKDSIDCAILHFHVYFSKRYDV